MIVTLYNRVMAEGRVPFEFRLVEKEKARFNLAKTLFMIVGN